MEQGDQLCGQVKLREEDLLAEDVIVYIRQEDLNKRLVYTLRV